MPVELLVALRFLREGRAQTVLVFSGAAVGVAVVLFLTALLAGLEQSLLEKTLSAQAHVVVEGRRHLPLPARPDDAAWVARRIDRATVRPATLRGTRELLARLDGVEAIRTASPVAATSAFAVRGELREPILVQGVDRARHEPIVRLDDRLVAGRVDLTGDRAVIGAGLAGLLHVAPGDAIRLVGPTGTDALFRVAGIARFGVAAADDQWVFVSVRRAQTLGGLGDEFGRIDVQLFDARRATEVAAGLRAQTNDADVTSWQERNPDLLAGIRAQGSSGLVIQLFVALAVALGIASVLVVSVVQRRGEIGVLRATGTRASTILRIFLWQGALVGGVGAVLGTGIGWTLIETFVAVVRDEDGGPLFPIVVTAQLVGFASLLAILTGLAAAIAPARSAARLDPVDAIRGR